MVYAARIANWRSKSALWYLLLGLAAACGFWFGSAAGQSSTETLSVDAAALALGDVWAQNGVQRTVTLTNHQSQPVRVDRIQASCACTSVQPAALTLQPGETRRLELKLDLDFAPSRDAWRWSEPLSIQVTLFLRDRPFQTFSLSGTLLRWLRLSAPALDFEHQLVHQHPFPRKSLRFQCESAATTVQARCDESLATVETRRVKPGSKEWHLHVSPRPQLAVGKHDFDVELFTAPTSKNRPLSAPASVRLRVRATVENDVIAVPSSIWLGYVNVGSVVEESVTLVSRHAPFQVLELLTDQPPALNSPPEALRQVPDFHPLTEKAQAATVAWRVPRAGQNSDTIRFLIGQKGKKYEVSIPVIYHGVAAQD